VEGAVVRKFHLEDIVLELVVAGHKVSSEVSQDVNDLVATNFFIQIGEDEKVVVQACRNAVEMRVRSRLQHAVSSLEDGLNASQQVCWKRAA